MMAGLTAVDMVKEQQKSLHQRILDDIQDNILGGHWPPGHKIPSEQQLTAQYGCSRMTVNKVLTQLARAGLIQRRRKAGSIVLPQNSQSAILEIYDIRDEVKGLGLAYGYEIRSNIIRAAAKDERIVLALGARQRVAAITCLHHAGEKPFCLEERLISLDVVPEAERESFGAMPPGPWLLEHVPWSAAEHRISAAGAKALAAEALRIEENAPVLVVERQTWRFDRAVTHVRFTYPGGFHSLTARFTPSQK